MNTFNEYGEFVKKTWFSNPEKDPRMFERDLAIMGLGIGGEAGEVQEKLKKVIRDGTTDREQILKELGDVVYYAVRIAQYFGFSAQDILDANVKKLEGRIERGTMRGSGDNR